MRRWTRRKGTSKQISKRRYKGTSKRTSKRVARKQSGGARRIDMAKLGQVIKKRKHAAQLAKTSAKMAQKLKDRIDSL